MSQAQSAGRKAGKSRDTNGNFLQSPRFLINVENPKAGAKQGKGGNDSDSISCF